MTPEEVGRALTRVENCIGVLQLRESGIRRIPHLPAALADATSAQLAAIAASDVVVLATHYQEVGA